MMNKIDVSRVDLNLLTLFEVVLEERHVGRAAARLNLSPSAISHGLGRLRALLQDPLFVRHPKGLNPTERALALKPAVQSLLDQARQIIADAAPFDPHGSTRRFVIGTVDSIAAVIAPRLMKNLRRSGATMSIAIKPIFPQEAVSALDRGAIELALVPPMGWPARMRSRELFMEDFVIAARKGHPLASELTLEDFTAARHVLVSSDGATRGFVDDALEVQGLSRPIALTVPNFLLALAVVAETDLLCAVPRSLARLHGQRFRVEGLEPPLALRRDPIELLWPAASAGDAGLDWLIEEICGAAP